MAESATPTTLPTTQEATITIQFNSVTALPEFQTFDGPEIQAINATICLKALPGTPYPVQSTLTLSLTDGYSFGDPVGEITEVGSSAGMVLESPTFVLEFGGGATTTYDLTLNLVRNGLPFTWQDPTIVFEPPS